MTAARGTRPHILQVVTHLSLGGAENVMLSLIEELVEQFDFTVFTALGVADTEIGRDMAARLAALSVDVIEGTQRPMKRGGMIAAGMALARASRRTPFDLIHVHTEIPEAALAVARLAAPSVRHHPTLRTIHNTDLWPQWAGVGRWTERRLQGVSAVAVSPGAAAGLVRMRIAAGVEQATVPVILNGVRLPPLATRRQYDDQSRRLLFAGRLEPQKGADLLPALLHRASALSPGPVEVEVVGDGSCRAAVAQALADLGNGWHGRLLPPEPALAARLGDFDALLMPSRFEGLPLLAVEALLAGTPVVSTRIEGLATVIAADDPLCVTPEDIELFAQAIAALLADPVAHRLRIAASAETMQARFNVGRMAGDYAAVYRRLIAYSGKSNTPISD